MAHSRWLSPLSPMPSMQMLSTTRPVTVAGFPLGACAAAAVVIKITNVPASAPTRLHALIGPPRRSCRLRLRNPPAWRVIPASQAVLCDAAVDQSPPGRDDEGDEVGLCTPIVESAIQLLGE